MDFLAAQSLENVAPPQVRVRDGSDFGLRFKEIRLAYVGLESIPRYRVYTRAMKIGELSKEATGVKVGTIRFYERKKLLRAAGRTPSGYRTYSEQDVNSVKGIRLTRI